MSSKTAIILGFGLPVIFALIISAVLYSNGAIGLRKVPKTNFYYATGVRWETFNTYEYAGKVPLFVLNGKIAFPISTYNTFLKGCEATGYVYLPNGQRVARYENIPSICTEKDVKTLLEYIMMKGVKIYEHDVVKNESRLMTSNEVLALQTINNTRTSPDGFVFEEYGYSRNGMSDFFFGGFGSRSYYSGPYLAYGSKIITLQLRADARGEQIHFLGWER